MTTKRDTAKRARLKPGKLKKETLTLKKETLRDLDTKREAPGVKGGAAAGTKGLWCI